VTGAEFHLTDLCRLRITHFGMHKYRRYRTMARWLRNVIVRCAGYYVGRVLQNDFTSIDLVSNWHVDGIYKCCYLGYELSCLSSCGSYSISHSDVFIKSHKSPTLRIVTERHGRLWNNLVSYLEVHLQGSRSPSLGLLDPWRWDL
jgi:hypothetical protein